MRVFIDANIYLGFLKSSGENVVSLSELLKLIKKNKVKLIFPKIIRNEFLRNTITATNEYRKEFNDHISDKKPIFASSIKNTKVKDDFDKKYKDYVTCIGKIKDEYNNSITKLTGKVLQLYSLSEKKGDSEAQLIEKAYNRFLLGEPPGKNKIPIGDQLSWEIILDRYADDDLTVISNDGDWGSSTWTCLLEEEWYAKTKKGITFLNSVGEFVNELTKTQTITDDEIKEEKINSLEASKISEVGFISSLPINFGAATFSSSSASLSILPSGLVDLSSANHLVQGSIVIPSGQQFILDPCQRHCRKCGKAISSLTVLDTCESCLTTNLVSDTD